MDPIIEAHREYIITDSTMDKCDLCKRRYARLFELTPSIKIHAWDSLAICIGCLDKCQLKYDIDINELRISGSVDAWQKSKK